MISGYLERRLQQIFQHIASRKSISCTHHWQDPAPTMFEQCGWYATAGAGVVYHRPTPRYLVDHVGIPARSSHDERGGSKCNKNSFKKNPGQAMLMFCTCLDHEVIVGWHLCQYEGRRSVMVPLLQCFPEAPKLVMYDFACGYVLQTLCFSILTVSQASRVLPEPRSALVSGDAVCA